MDHADGTIDTTGRAASISGRRLDINPCRLNRACAAEIGKSVTVGAASITG
jgi:hypothetical protein